MKFRDGDQPLPKASEATDCQTTFLARINHDVPIRRQLGISRYGTALQPFNQRDVARDVWEEYVDLGQYIEQMRRERDAMIALLVELCQVGDADAYEALDAYDAVSDRADELLTSMGIVANREGRQHEDAYEA